MRIVGGYSFLCHWTRMNDVAQICRLTFYYPFTSEILMFEIASANVPSVSKVLAKSKISTHAVYAVFKR